MSAAELENLHHERDSLQMVKMVLEREISEIKRELMYNKHLRTMAEANVKIFKAKIDYLKGQQQPVQKLDNGIEREVNGVEPEVNANMPSPVNMNESVLENTATPLRRPAVKNVRMETERCNQQ